MTAEQVLIANLVRTGVFLVLVGLLVRKRASLCWSFPAYLAAIVVCNSLVSLWPERFFVWSFYIVTRSVYTLLRLCITVELAYRIFRAFPGAFARARLLIVPLLAVMAFGIVQLAEAPSVDYEIVELRAQTAGIWMLTATALLVVWFNLPIHPLHRAVLLGLTAYQLIFTSLVNLLRELGFEEYRQFFSTADNGAYLLLVAWWGFTAWRPDRLKARLPLPELSPLEVHGQAGRA